MRFLKKQVRYNTISLPIYLHHKRFIATDDK